MELNITRIKQDFDGILQFNQTSEKGWTRFSFSEEDKMARDYLIGELKKLGVAVGVDGIGNIRAKYGSNLNQPSIMIGSHIDTVKHGGRFDGLTGVLVALEMIRVFKEENIQLNRPIELICFSEEEGSNFGITMLGSKAITGKLTVEDLKEIKNPEGVSAYELAKGFGLEVDQLPAQILKQNEIDSMIELHIEQGAVLEHNGKSVGIVEAISGMSTYKITLKGDSNHAGTTPMEYRSDPMVGAAEIIASIQKAAKHRALPTTVATVGKIKAEPNVPNIIPQQVEFYVDIRDVQKKGIELVSMELEDMTKQVANEHRLTAIIEKIGSSEPVKLSSRLIKKMEECVQANNSEAIKLNSGAVHDVAMLKDVAEIGMVFIPSLAGKSHCPEEYTDFQDIKLGGDFLLNVVYTLATETQKV